MAIKVKISELSKDLNVENQELIDILYEYDETKRKPATTLTKDELDYILEKYSQENQVSSFDEYFATRNYKKEENEKKEAVAESKKAVKAVEKAKDKSEQKATEKSKEKATAKDTEKEKKKTEAKDTDTEEAKEKVVAKNDEKAKEKSAKPAKETAKKEQKKEEPMVVANKTEEVQKIKKENKTNDVTKYEDVKQKENEDNAAGNKKKSENARAKSSTPKVKTKLNANLAGESVIRNSRTVDTRGTYVELDKYNERYEAIATHTESGRGKDNYSNKQKISQRSAQRKKKHNKKETEAEMLRRLELERARKQQLRVKIPDLITVGELATRLKVTAAQVIKQLMGLDVMATITQEIDFDTASLVAEELGAKVEKEVIVTIEERLINEEEDDPADLVERDPVVVVMGHVDHGKTSLLDRIRNATVTASEAGGITQHIGAYKVSAHGKNITFLDTPGHEAFTSMRARGASITDIAILVVAADDGIMPQTVEAINHAKAANVAIIVAINKMDKETANPDRIKQELTEHGLVIEEWGGDTICVPVSAKTGYGIDDLLENILLVAEMQELKANPDRKAKGTVIEARLDKGRGPSATVLVQNGTLHKGDIIIAGTAVGRVRVMTNHKGDVVKEAGPSDPVEITGLDEVPSAGDIFNVVEDEKLARELVDQRRHMAKEEQFSTYQKVTLDNLFSQIEQGEIKELPIIVKADVQGSVEAVKQSLEKLSNEEVRVRVIHGGVGAVSESDVMLANASNAVIVGFNVRPDPIAAENAALAGVDIRLYRIIYDAIEEVTTAMKGMLAPKFREVNLGRIEVRQVYKISNVGMVSGCYVLDGKVNRNCEIRVVRDGIVVAEDKIASLKRFKDDVKEVAQGYECGISLEKFSDVKEGDIYEAYIIEEYKD